MLAPTVKNGTTRIYLTDGTAGSTSVPSEFWRTDNANQPAAALLASEGPGATEPPPPGIPFPANFNGWQKLTSSTTASPYYATFNFCTGQCWYDQYVYTPAGLPDTVYVLGSYNYGELPCNTKGVGCGNGRSNGRAVLYSTTAGDPDASATGTALNRTFTDLTFDMQNDPSATWCALGDAIQQDFGGVAPGYTCLWAPAGIHPDQHAIVVNPSNPTQIFEGSDGGVIRTDGTFGDLSSRCNSNERRPSRHPRAWRTVGECFRACRRRSRTSTATTTRSSSLTSPSTQGIQVRSKAGRRTTARGRTTILRVAETPGLRTSTETAATLATTARIPHGGSTSSRAAFTDANFQNGDPTKWVIIWRPLVNSGEAVGFYWPQVARSEPADRSAPDLLRAPARLALVGVRSRCASRRCSAGHNAEHRQSTRRTVLSSPRSATPRCGDFQPLGGPVGSNNPVT